MGVFRIWGMWGNVGVGECGVAMFRNYKRLRCRLTSLPGRGSIIYGPRHGMLAKMSPEAHLRGQRAKQGTAGFSGEVERGKAIMSDKHLWRVASLLGFLRYNQHTQCT